MAFRELAPPPGGRGHRRGGRRWWRLLKPARRIKLNGGVNLHIICISCRRCGETCKWRQTSLCCFPSLRNLPASFHRFAAYANEPKGRERGGGGWRGGKRRIRPVSRNFDTCPRCHGNQFGHFLNQFSRRLKVSTRRINFSKGETFPQETSINWRMKYKIR